MLSSKAKKALSPNTEFIDLQGIVPRARHYFAAGINFCLVGPAGIGKTTLVHELAGGVDNIRTIIGGEMHVADLLGGLRLINSETVWLDGPVAEAAEKGLTLYADELTGFNEDCLRVLHSLLDFRRRIFVAANNREVAVHPDFRFVASCNLSATGIDPLTREFRDRLVYIHMNRLDSCTEAKLLCDRYDISVEDAEYLIQFAAVTRKADQNGGASTRQLESAALAVSRGVARFHAAADCILSSIAGSSTSQRDSLLNMVKAEGLELNSDWVSRPVENSVVVTDEEEVWS